MSWRTICAAAVLMLVACNAAPPVRDAAGEEVEVYDLTECPGWDPIIHFGAPSTPAGSGFAGVFSSYDWYAYSPPLGRCYADCVVARTAMEGAMGTLYAPEFTYDSEGRLVEIDSVGELRA